MDTKIYFKISKYECWTQCIVRNVDRLWWEVNKWQIDGWIDDRKIARVDDKGPVLILELYPQIWNRIDWLNSILFKIVTSNIYLDQKFFLISDIISDVFKFHKS